MKSNKVSSFVYLSIVMAMLFWAMSYVWIKIVYQCYNPITTVFIRLVIASPLTYAAARWLKKLQPIQRRDIKFFILISLLQPFLYFMFESYGLKFASPTVAAVIVSTIPLFTPIAAFYLFKEKLSLLNIVGLLVSFTGVLLVIIKADFSLAVSPMGLVLLLLAVVAGVAYINSVKKISFNYNALTIVTYQNILGTFWFLPFFLVVDLGHFLNAAPTSDVLISLGLLALLPTSLAFILFAYSVKELGASRSSMFGNIIPVFTAAFAWLMLNDEISIRMMIGIAVVITGLFAAQVRKK
ncbi:MAG: EamA family transporter [Candidatus Aminicenantes bacterium]|nr:EamA family transporter [Candidatus Aminicenantes bacterium]NIM84741.1 EamA family transporter [Candidatus Aminicenantes bacterium]NIN23296.1 EamA family transporter [Candidatus Aminicenantes bacterium]NIN47000.1 EamA family transporter [Candidatus Aminicenantes bacterium]NIN89922.1 EamA family transporter [Candidatus Aminicenantes bacterium]